MNHEEEEEQKENNFIKIVIVGQSSVGKTALINQYMNKIFIDAAITTIGTDKFIKVEKINDIEIKLNIWDTAGQERFRSLSQMFIKNSDICMLVYDITNELSFNDLKDYWLNLVKENLSNIIIGVIANKSDLYPEEVVHEETGRKFAEKEGLYFYITSAKEHQSILTVFNDLINKYVEKYGFVHNYSSFDNSAMDRKHSINSNSTSKKKKVACCN